MAGSNETVSNRFRYVGKFGVMDEGNGLLFMRARYYDPDVGRFITKDPIGFTGGVNLYGYAGNNPYTYIDPVGLCAEKSWWKSHWQIPTGIAIGVVAGMTTAYFVGPAVWAWVLVHPKAAIVAYSAFQLIVGGMTDKVVGPVAVVTIPIKIVTTYVVGQR